MKLNWFSPLPPARSGIADYAAEFLPVLAERCDVTVWAAQDRWDPALERSVHVRACPPEGLPWRDLNVADVTVYHLGNNAPFHGAIWEVSRLLPGIVVLHDVRLHHFFAGLPPDRWGGSTYVDEVERLYGAEARREAERGRTSAEGVEPLAERWPMTELAVESALGALVHTRAGFEALVAAGRCPVALAELPLHAGRPPVRRAGGRPARVVTVGHMGRNRRLPELLEALAGVPRDALRLDVYGELEEERRLYQLARERGVSEIVTFHGHVPPSDLHAALDAADLAINLRWPTMGEASLSQLVLWRHALPTVVTRVGWYAELPPDAVLFVDPDREVEELQGHLTDLVERPERFREMGRHARQALETRHSPARYADALLELAERAVAWRPRSSSVLLAGRVAEGLAGWTDAADAAGLVGRAGDAVHDLLLAATASDGAARTSNGRRAAPA